MTLKHVFFFIAYAIAMASGTNLESKVRGAVLQQSGQALGVTRLRERTTAVLMNTHSNPSLILSPSKERFLQAQPATPVGNYGPNYGPPTTVSGKVYSPGTPDKPKVFLGTATVDIYEPHDPDPGPDLRRREKSLLWFSHGYTYKPDMTARCSDPQLCLQWDQGHKNQSPTQEDCEAVAGCVYSEATCSSAINEDACAAANGVWQAEYTIRCEGTTTATKGRSGGFLVQPLTSLQYSGPVEPLYSEAVTKFLEGGDTPALQFPALEPKQCFAARCYPKNKEDPVGGVSKMESLIAAATAAADFFPTAAILVDWDNSETMDKSNVRAKRQREPDIEIPAKPGQKKRFKRGKVVIVGKEEVPGDNAMGPPVAWIMDAISELKDKERVLLWMCRPRWDGSIDPGMLTIKGSGGDSNNPSGIYFLGEGAPREGLHLGTTETTSPMLVEVNDGSDDDAFTADGFVVVSDPLQVAPKFPETKEGQEYPSPKAPAGYEVTNPHQK